MQLSSSSKMRDADDRAAHIFGIPSSLLMTNAAIALADVTSDYLTQSQLAVVFCGPGNNGGDGVGAALCLMRRGAFVRCFLVGEREKMSRDCAEMEHRLLEQGGALEKFDPESEEQSSIAAQAGVIVDAIFGIGLNRELAGDAKAATELINASGVPVVSADIPSGVVADTGSVPGAAVRANMTVAFTRGKPGHFVEPGCAFCGLVKVVDIGVPKELSEASVIPLHAVFPEDIKLPNRFPVSHKGDYGRLLVVGGSVGYTGAPVLCSMGAARSGAGLISVGVPESIYGITAGRLLEAMPFPLPGDGTGKLSYTALPIIRERLKTADVCVLGCGLGRSGQITDLVRELISETQCPMVIDADGLFALGDLEETISTAPIPPVLTPHEGEFLRLGGTLTGDRVKDAVSFAQSRNCILVLKGHRTICAFPDGQAHIIAGGNAGMAKGGCGDLLAGMIGAMSCQLPCELAVKAACSIHAAAGDMCAKTKGQYAMLPADMVDCMPNIMLKMER